MIMQCRLAKINQSCYISASLLSKDITLPDYTFKKSMHALKNKISKSFQRISQF